MDDLYYRKYQYERLIKQLEDSIIKLENAYSNLIICKKIIGNCLRIDGNYYQYQNFENNINNLNGKKNEISNVILPQARYEYNIILSEISKLVG